MKKVLAALAFALGAVLGTSPASAAIVVTFTPASQHVNVGDTVNVEMSISGLGDEILSAFDLNFVYDGGILSWNVFSGTAAYGELGGGYAPAVNPLFNLDSLVNGNLGARATAVADDATVAANQANDFLMFQFTLTASADGVTSFTLGPDLDFERNFVGLSADSLNVTVIGACIAVGAGECRQQVPEPSTLSLLGLALMGLTLLGLRRRRIAV